MTPNDPLSVSQWHLRMLGGLETIWNDYTGAGIHVGIYDSGIDAGHIDLKAHYDASRHVVIDGRVLGAAPDDSAGNANNWHGTAVAGLIGAVGNNRTGVVGVSWGASLTGVNILGTTSPAYLNAPDPVGFLSAVHQMTRFDVTNGSWNATPGYLGAYQDLNDPESFAARLAAEYASVSARGRGGLGTVIVQSAGNDHRDVNGNGTNAIRHSITVAACNEDGFAASYSNYGSSVLLTAPGSEVAGSILTTDRSGVAGLTSGDYMDSFNGTSAAAPIVTGAVALMLEANPALGWRDVQTILAASASHTGSRIGASRPAGTESVVWQVNGADTWNGGGMHVSNDYGYGLLDAYAAVRMAEAWTNFSPVPRTSANELRVSTGTRTVDGDTHIPDGRALTTTLHLSASMILEHVDLTLTLRHGNFEFLEIYATSPEGTRIRLHDGSAAQWSTAATGLTWTFGIDSLRGEAAAGTWTVEFVDTALDTADGTVTSLALTATGTRPTVDDVYHYTDELAAMSALDAGRLTLADTDGGIDWIDAAAVTGPCFVDLTPGGKSTLDGKTVVMGRGTIENAVTGDGNDVLVANKARNTLVGGRGDDVYRLDSASDVVIEKSGQGADTVVASVSYRLAAGQSVETLLAADRTGTAAIDLTGNELANALRGTNGANRLDGGLGADTMTGLGGDDVYVVDDAGDRTVETDGRAGGTDTVLASVGTCLAENVEVLTLTGSAALTGIGNAQSNLLTGNSGANLLDGRGGVDRMIGGRGDDTYGVDQAGDRVEEAAGQGRDVVRASVSYTLGSGQAIEGLTTTRDAGTDAINLAGNEDANSLRGNVGANVLAGRGGADTLKGLGGADTFVFDTALAAGQVDHIVDFSVRDDTIRLENAVFAGLAAGRLAADAFKDLALARADADDRLLYDHRTGALSYDSDGSGAAKAVPFAVIDTKALLTFADFLVA